MNFLDSDFIRIQPRYTRDGSEYMGDKVRLSFPIIKGEKQILLFIGKDVARKYDIKKGERLLLFIDKINNLKWVLLKNPEGYKTGLLNGHIKLQIQNSLIPNKGWSGTKYVGYELDQGCLVLKLPGMEEIEKQL